MKRPLSVCIITFNEEENIRTCLESVKWADEIIVVDSRSTDRTVSICKEYTERIFVRDFPGYRDQKNYAVKQATYNWILSIDADEEVSHELQLEMKDLLEANDLKEVGFYMSRKTEYIGEWVTYGRWYPDLKLRLFDKRYGCWEGENLHESVSIQGPTRRLKGDLLHRTYRDLSHHLQVINNFTTISAQQKKGRKIGHPTLKAIFHPLAYFLNSYILRRGIFHGTRGLILSVMGSYYVFLKYAKLWELYQMDKQENSSKRD